MARKRASGARCAQYGKKGVARVSAVSRFRFTLAFREMITIGATLEEIARSSPGSI
jgi:hypothetical protein